MLRVVPGEGLLCLLGLCTLPAAKHTLNKILTFCSLKIEKLVWISLGWQKQILESALCKSTVA